MSGRFHRHAAGAALLALSLTSHGAAGQDVGHHHATRGSFVGSDSLDASKEASSANRSRHQLHGVATWTIERDTLDLRPKFTMRLELPAPSPVTIVIRALDSLPPAPGRYTFFLASAGASHSRPGVVNASIYAREGKLTKSYLPIGVSLVVTSTRLEDGAPVVTGRVVLRAERYAEAPEVTQIRDYVWLNITGDFTAVPAPERRPVVAVTEKMQRAVLERALDGFGITWVGAVNGDGAVDSTHSPAPGRAFLTSRWRDALVVEHIEASDRTYRVRLRGRFVPVICEQAPTELNGECTTLPSPVANQAATHGPGDIAGTMRGLSAAESRGADIFALYLVPNPAPIRDAFAALCSKREEHESADEAALEAKMRGLTMRQMDSAVQSLVYAKLDAEDRKNERLISSVAVRHASVKAGAAFAFAGVPAGNYLLLATLRTTPIARHWYVPVVVQSGVRTDRDLDAGNVSPGGWGCDGPHPFPMIHEGRR